MAYQQAKQKGQCTCCASSKRDAGDVDQEMGDANEFGDKRWYWNTYNDITDRYDADMMDRLNTSLDNLLIFVSNLLQKQREICTDA